MTRLPTCPPPPPADATGCLPKDTPAATRRAIEAIVEAWRACVRQHQAGMAELARLAKLPADLAGVEILDAHRAAVADIEAAALDWLMQRRPLAAAFAAVKPLAREDARKAREALELRKVEVAIAVRTADPLAPDAAIAEAHAADRKLSEMRAAAHAAESRLRAVEGHATPDTGGKVALWCRDRLAVSDALPGVGFERVS